MAADAGTVTVTEYGGVSQTVKKITFVWTSAAGGAADKQTVLDYSGAVQRVVTIPTGGGTAPTDQYDCTLLDDDGADVCYGNAANRATATIEQILPANLGHIAGSKLYLHVTNAGAAKSGTLIAYIR
jgi:hypothetical protein